ncbi:hypothetical protein [Scytonema sp. PCC 10023]|uniref:hypothetical protein n=1 Tax=Scytonema sp. PCC 10023 TaxID=1680591 RepID=UPI0039C726BD
MKFTSAYANTHFAIFQRPNYLANKLNKKFNPASAPQPQSLWNAIAQAKGISRFHLETRFYIMFG